MALGGLKDFIEFRDGWVVVKDKKGVRDAMDRLVCDAVFEPGTAEMRAQWTPRMTLLLSELRKAPAVLRLSYLADIEDEQLVQRRLQAVKTEIMQAWKALDCCYQLTVEPEVFWRLGAPPKQATVRGPASR